MDLVVPDKPSTDPAANLALEEALVRAIPPAPLLRIWQNEACVVLGRGQRLEREVNVAAAAAAGVPVLRRASGGGTVYHDLGNLNITMAVPGWVPGLTGELAALVAGVLRRLGLAPAITERGVFVGAVKLSGLAAQLTRTATLAHATLLVTTPAPRVREFLAPAPPDHRPLDSRRSPVLPLCEMARGMSVPAARSLVLAEAAERYGPLVPRAASAAEMCWHERLMAQRYGNGTWHATGRAPVQPTETKEAQWTTKPALSCTGLWCLAAPTRRRSCGSTTRIRSRLSISGPGLSRGRCTCRPGRSPSPRASVPTCAGTTRSPPLTGRITSRS